VRVTRAWDELESMNEKTNTLDNVPEKIPRDNDTLDMMKSGRDRFTKKQCKKPKEGF
jgi:hypothetical protein